MARSRGNTGGGARRPTAAPAASRPQQTRPATTMAHPQAPSAQQTASKTAPPQAQPAGQSMMGSILSTAAGVATGSLAANAIGGLFSGGSSQQMDQSSMAEGTQYNSTERICGADIDNFRKCMDQNEGSLTICGWYLDTLKACQAARTSGNY